MTNAPNNRPEETLDPQDWDAMRALGHRMMDDMLDYLQNVRERPVWQPVPEEAKANLSRPLPDDPQSAESVYADFQRDVMPYPMGNIHPRFWGWVIGTGTPLGVMADMLSAMMNVNVGGGAHAAPHVEAQVIEWCKQMMGFPAGASGVLVNGASMANFVALNVARNAHSGFNVRQDGLQGHTPRLRVYASIQAHTCIQRAVELLGLGRSNLCSVPVNADYQMDITALEQMIAADRAAGHQPLAIVGTAGTVNTGAFDDLQTLADIAERENLWFHVDGAFGALAAITPDSRHYAAGMERANSLAFDLHKWMYVPYDVACVLVRDRDQHRQAFSVSPDYLSHTERGVSGIDLWFTDYTVELSRSFRALKVWMSIKEHGIEKYGRLIQQNIDQTRYLAGLVDAEPKLERLAPAPLNILCFRYVVPGMDDAALNAFNEELLIRLQESGVAAPSNTRLNGRYAIRVANTNHRSRREDFDLLVQTVVQLGDALAAEQR
jgi:glutamate/tyrosine decarboxylase-like PLP-dependent enzyme